MSYFLPSFFQKRVFRYALSRLQLVDTDALDLDSLGITWGQRSTFELRDLGLRLDKLAELLQLPPTCDVTKAQVSLVRVTIPADIYSSGIIVEVEGVDVRLRLLPDEDCQGRGHGSDDGGAASVADSNQSGGEQSHRILPSTKDLAQSFLESEPQEETEELKAALSAQSQHLHQSEIFSDEEDEEDVGLSEGVSLPSFVAGFIKGILDRLQLKIVDVTLRVDMEVRPGTIPSKQAATETPDSVAAVLTVDEITVDGVAAETVEDTKLKAGKRLTMLSGIHFLLLSEPLVFESYSRFNPPPSSPVSHMGASRGLGREGSSPSHPASSSSSFPAMSRATIFERPSIHLGDSSPHLQASLTSHDGRFSDAATDDGYEGRDGTHEPGDMVGSQDELPHSAYLDDDARYADDIENSTDGFYPSTWSHRESDAGRSDEGHPLPPTNASPEFSGYSPVEAASTPTRSSFAQSRFPEPQDLGDREEYMDAEQTSTDPYAPGSEGNADSPTEDLSESKLFTHEEAQSMYMSAMSHVSDDGPEVYRMPGTLSSSPEEQSHPISSETAADDGTKLSRDPEAQSTPRASGIFSSVNYGEAQDDRDSDEASPTKPYSEPTDSPGLPEPLSSVSKKILDVERVTLWIPSFGDQPTEEAPAEIPRKPALHMKESTFTLLQESMAHDAPERSKSRLSHAGLARDLLASSPPSDRQAPRRSDDAFEKLTDGEMSRALEVDVSSIDVKLDIACGWIFAKAVQRLVTAWTEDEQTEKQKSQPNSPSVPLSLSLGTCRVEFLEHLAGQAYQLHRAPLPELGGMDRGDVILYVSLSGTTFNTTTVGGTVKSRLNVSKFVFGHGQEDLISFDDSLRMRESTRDVRSPNHGDISISFSKSPGFSQLHISTLPLHLALNLSRLDETLSWFGGLSTVLELGSSVASTSTVRGGKQSAPPKPRGVHFEQTAPGRESDSAKKSSIPWKVNCRLGGLAVNLVGKKCTLKLETTAVKLVSRYSGLGIQIDKARLSGPHHALTLIDDPVPHVDLLIVRLEYLFEPKEVDLDRLLNLLTPSKDKFHDDDDIMLDTLFKQRRQGGVLRVSITNMTAFVPHPELLQPLSTLGEEFAKLSTVAKYIPQDDRPGIMTLGLVREFEGHINLGPKVGTITATSQGMEGCVVSFPSLLAGRVSAITVIRNGSEEIIGEAVHQDTVQGPLPMIMARYIPDEMDPTVKLKLFNLRAEYTVPFVSALLGLSGEMTTEDIVANMAHSVVNLAELKPHGAGSDDLDHSSLASDAPWNPPKLSVSLRDCLVGLNPKHSPAKGLVVFTEARFWGALHEDEPSEAAFEVQKASLMIIDNAAHAGRRLSSSEAGQVQVLEGMGYVPVALISSACAAVKIMQLEAEAQKSLDIEVKDDLLVIETCADSTQTLLTIFNGLALPSPPNKSVKYRTEVVPIEDMLGSFSGNAFQLEQLTGFAGASADVEGLSPIDEDADADELEYVSDFYPSSGPRIGDAADGGYEPFGSFHSEAQMSSSAADLDFQEDHFARQSAVGGTAHRWDSTHNTYSLANEVKLRGSPLRVRIRDVHVIWNLFDGYDWQRTRDTISKAVKDVQAKATERRARASPADEDEESVIGDFLFNSVYIGIPTTRDPRELAHEINRNIDDLASETGSYATSTTVTGLQSHQPGKKREKLRLARSKHHKMTFELKGIAADMVVFPPGSGETQSSLDIRIRDLEIFDHLPTSTWKKFATYMSDAGEREVGMSMVHLEVLNVKPVADLAASELIIKATVLPLRLHVDQDALDFMSRFFEFKDDSVPVHASPSDIPFIQRAEVNGIQVRLDFKPKRVDYAGLRSGRTTEFMNFFILDEADMVLRHVIIYGISGFDRLGQTLNDIWMPDVKANQLPSVLAGLAPVKSLVNIGSGFKDLVVIPMREYKKDGRVVRSIQKGALAFAKTTTNELVKLGAKLAIGTQTALQNAEGFLNNPGGTPAAPVAAAQEGRLEDTSIDEDEKKQISLYADQPLGVVQGLRGAYASLERDILLARDAIVAVPGEVMESGSATGAAKALWNRAPTVILRPAIGASKAVGQTLLGAGNTLDPRNRRRVDDKYKRH